MQCCRCTKTVICYTLSGCLDGKKTANVHVIRHFSSCIQCLPNVGANLDGILGDGEASTEGLVVGEQSGSSGGALVRG